MSSRFRIKAGGSSKVKVCKVLQTTVPFVLDTVSVSKVKVLEGILLKEDSVDVLLQA